MTDKLFEEGKVDFNAYYDIFVYATADGYKVSDKATARLYRVKTDGQLDNTATGIAAKSMRASWYRPTTDSCVSAVSTRMSPYRSTLSMASCSVQCARRTA